MVGSKGVFGADPAFVASQSSQEVVSTRGFNPGEIADRLDAAGALVAAGWVQQSFERCSASGVCYCAAGALYRATRDDPEEVEEEAFAVLMNAIGVPPATEWIFEWNDAPDRTQAEVIAAFRKAADLARAEAR